VSGADATLNFCCLACPSIVRSLQSRDLSPKRPWLAVVLTAIVPGLGHAYLRLWGRALLWIALTALGVVFMVPLDVLGELTSAEALVEVWSSLPPAAIVAVVSIIGFCGLDAYLMAQRINHFAGDDADQPARCPSCGKEIDGDLDFCHWCTTELDDANG
jgi:hypothetical protein